MVAPVLLFARGMAIRQRREPNLLDGLSVDACQYDLCGFGGFRELTVTGPTPVEAIMLSQ